MTNILYPNTFLSQTNARTAAAAQKRTLDSINDAELHSMASRTRAVEMKNLWRQVIKKLRPAKATLNISTSAQNDDEANVTTKDQRLQHAA